MTLSKLGQATLQALKCLKPSGEKSFEKLTATLLSRLIGMSIRLCKSGYQGGIDALAGIPIVIEDKRYQAGTLDLNELQGKLAEAARIYLDLQLWVLTATVSLDPFNKHALEQTAEFLFDWLRDNLTTLPVPVSFIGSKHGMNSAKNLGDHVLNNIKQVLGSFERHARAILRCQRDIKAGATP
jgi:hypothetical protein